MDLHRQTLTELILEAIQEGAWSNGRLKELAAMTMWQPELFDRSFLKKKGLL